MSHLGLVCLDEIVEVRRDGERVEVDVHRLDHLPSDMGEGEARGSEGGGGTW